MDKQAHVTTEQVSYGYSESEIPTEEYALHCHNFYEVYFSWTEMWIIWWKVHSTNPLPTAFSCCPPMYFME